jgi:hypothetical protein
MDWVLRRAGRRFDFFKPQIEVRGLRGSKTKSKKTIKISKRSFKVIQVTIFTKSKVTL